MQLRLQSPRLEGALSGALHDACIPFPRTSAAKFNGIGLLAIFGQVLNQKRLTLRQQNTQTPRTLSAINGGGLLGNVVRQPVLYAHRDSNASFYLQDRINTNKHAKNRTIAKPTTCTPIVHIYDASRLLNISRDVADAYSLDKHNLIATCRHNRQVCETHGFYELAPIWTLAEMIAIPNLPDEQQNAMLYRDPYKKLLLEVIIMHCASVGDIQSAVMLACLFHNCTPAASTGNTVGIATQKFGQQLTPTASPYHTIGPLDYNNSTQSKFVSSNHAVMQQLKQLRSNSWSDSLDWVDSKMPNNSCDATSLIRRAKLPLFDHFKLIYADLLFAWQLLTKCALIMKHTTFTKSLQQGGFVDFVAECGKCYKPKRVATCGTCHRHVMYCIICCMAVKGLATACLGCGHGGHTTHMKNWFQKHNVCATGCGCRCLEKTALILDHIHSLYHMLS